MRKYSVKRRDTKPKPPNVLEEWPEGKLRRPSATNLASPVQTIDTGRYLGLGAHLEMKSGLRRPTGDYN